MRFPLPRPTAPTTVRWTSPAFVEELQHWAQAALGTEVRLENHTQRPWATVCKVHAPDGLFWAKQNCPGQNYEAGLVSRLVAWTPEHVVHPVAVDEDRGLLLSPDAGEVLGNRDARDVDAWCEVVAQWGAVQRQVVDQVRTFEDLPVFHAGDAVQFVAERVEQLAALEPDDVRRLAPDSAERLVALLPVVQEWADVVAAPGLPLTLNHNDLHAWNVFAPVHGEALRFFDFGDAVVAEPLSALLIPLQGVSDQVADDRRHAVRARVRDAFLEVWSDLAPVAEMRAAVPAALKLGRLMRHESWARVSTAMDPSELAEFGNAPALWLETLLDPPPDDALE